jgi:transposase
LDVGRKAIRSPEEKLSVVLSVLRGEMTQVEVARRLELSQTTVSKWLKQFTEGGREALARGDNARAPSSKREAELQARVDELTSALGEAYVELRVWRKGGALYPPSRTLT